MTQNNNSAKLNMYMYVPSSVVQTGVKSAGWLQKQTHESPAHSLKVIEPTVDSFVKFGNVSVLSHRVSKERDKTGISTKNVKAVIATDSRVHVGLCRMRSLPLPHADHGSLQTTLVLPIGYN